MTTNQIFTAYTLSSLLFVTIGCSKVNKLNQITWTPRSQTPAPTAANGPLGNKQFNTDEISLITNDEIIERAPQKFGAAEIENTFLQKITSKTTGNLLFVKAQYTDTDYSKLTDVIAKWDTQKFAFIENLKKTNPSLKNSSEIFPPKIVIQNSKNKPHVVYSIDYVDSAKTGVYRMKVSPTSGIESIEKVSSDFEQGKGMVFPNGPKVSALSEVILSGLLGDGSLSKQGLRVNAQSSEKAHSSNLVFDYDPQDVRFDQVQSFYFVDKALTFFQSKLGTTLPFSLEVQTNYGVPEKLNAMFYYHGQIRLGTGDGVSYANIMKDPSIVIHESCHAFIEAVARLPLGEGEGGSLNEGFADFLTAVILDNPNLGEVAYLKGPYKRTVNNTKVVSDKNGGLYHDSLILSGTFWEIKQVLGEQKALKLAVKTLSRLGPNGDFQSIDPAVRYALDSDFSDSDKQITLDILKKRGWY